MSSIKIRTKRIDGQTQVRTLITHPMENGRRHDKQGQLIPTHFIQQLQVLHNEQVVIDAHLGAGISKNPYFDFLLRGGEVGDKITISWTDNRGNSDLKTYLIQSSSHQ